MADPPVVTPVEAPAQSLTDAFKSGALTFQKGENVPVRLSDGSIGTVPAEHAQSVVDSGGELVTGDEYKAAENEARYGGVGGALAAVGEGAARGLTVGISDPLAIGAARAFGGEQAAAATREHLAGVKEAHPIVSMGSELAGAAAPLVFSGGASAPVEAAEVANVAREGFAAEQAASRVAQAAGVVRTAVRGAGVANRGIAAAGEAASGLTRAVVGEGGEGIAAFARKLAASTASGATEGSLYGIGNQISEDSLGDHELNAEKLLAAAGHGALLGGVLSGTLESAGALSREVLGRMAPRISAAAEEQAWKSLSPLKKFSEQAEARMVGGTKGVGRVLLDEGVIPDTLTGATPEQLLPRIQAAKDRVGAELSEAMAASGARVRVDEIMRTVDDVIKPLEKKAGFESVVSSLQKYRESLIEKLAPMVETEAAPTLKKMVERRLSVGELETMGIRNWTPADAAEHGVTFRGNKAYVSEPIAQAPEKMLARPHDVSVQALFEQRKALDDLVYKEAKSLDPQMRVAFMRDIRKGLADMEIQSIESAGKALGKTGEGAALKDLRKSYQALSIAEDAAETTTSRMATNRNFSLSDNLHGAAMLASGHLALAPVVAAAHKVVRERGNAVAASLLNKMHALYGVEQAAQRVDRQIERGVTGLLKAGGEVRKRVAPFPSHAESVKAVARAVADADGHADAIERATADIAEHAPNTANAFQRTAISATSFLASKIPPSARRFHSPTPHAETPRVSDADADKFARYVQAVHDPVGILDDMKRGQVSREQVEAVKAVYPKLYQQIVQRIQSDMSERKTPVPYETRKQMSILFGTPLDPTLTPAFVKAMQSTFAGAPSQPQSTPAPTTGGAPKRSLKGLGDSLRLPGQ